MSLAHFGHATRAERCPFIGGRADSIGRGFHSLWWDMSDILPGADTPTAWARPTATVKVGRRPPAKRVALTGAE